jgi:hypothetical protein
VGFRRNKRGDGFETLVIILSVIIAGIIIIGVATWFVSKSSEPRAKAICAASVATRANAVIRGIGSEVHLTPLLCTTFDAEINAKGKPHEEVIAELLEYAVDTWQMFGEGKYVALDNIYFGLSGGNMCFRAYNVKVSGLDSQISWPTIETYAIHHNVSNMNISYKNYFEARPNCHLAVLNNIEDKNIYSIVFASVKLKPVGATSYNHNILYIVKLGEPVVTRETYIFGVLYYGEDPCTFVSGVGGK